MISTTGQMTTGQMSTGQMGTGQIPVSSQRERVGSAIARASAASGVDFGYMLNQARMESGLNPAARARTSSAAGLYQFIEQTWLATVKKHGAANGIGWAADSIQRGSDGRYRVADPATRHAILELRGQPETAAAMAGAFAADNRDYLQSRLGRPVASVDLYLAHFLGAAGAARFLNAHDSDSSASAAAVLPAAARANRAVFFNHDGSARSLAEIRDRFAARINGGGNGPVPALDAPRDLASVRMASRDTAGQPLGGPSPQFARLAYLMLAGLGG